MISIRAQFQRIPFRRRLSLLLLVPCLIVLLIALTVMLFFQSLSMRANLEREMRAAAEIVGHNSLAAIAFDDDAAAARMLDALRAIPHVKAAVIVLSDGDLFAHYGEPEAVRTLAAERFYGSSAVTEFRGQVLRTSMPLVLDGKRIASLQLLADLGGVYRGMLNMGLALALVATAMAALVAAGVSEALKHFISNPVMRLSATARQVAEAGDCSVRATEEPDSEFGMLTRTFNLMLQRIQSQDGELQQYSQQLAAQVAELQREIAERKRAQAELGEVHQQLLAASHQAGRMAEVASGVLHNVGNVLNSVNVSASLVSDRMRESHSARLSKLAGMLESNRANIGAFLENDPRGKLVPDYLAKLAAHLEEERSSILKEMELLARNVEHIKQIVAIQQSYTRVAGVTEDLPIQGLVEDALCIQANSLQQLGAAIDKEFPVVPLVRVDKHKVLQILVNLFRNARHALAESGRKDMRLRIRVSQPAAGKVRVEVADNGIGIDPENLTRVFQHGFTTKRNGHGFGLHSGALAAREMGGTMWAESKGRGQGATLILELPAAPEKENLQQ
jgi:signal transduction histidine kinase